MNMLNRSSIAGQQWLRLREIVFWRIFALGHCQVHPHCMERLDSCGEKANYAGYNARAMAWWLKFGVWAPDRLRTLCHNKSCVNPGHLKVNAPVAQLSILVVESASQRLCDVLG